MRYFVHVMLVGLAMAVFSGAADAADNTTPSEDVRFRVEDARLRVGDYVRLEGEMVMRNPIPSRFAVPTEEVDPDHVFHKIRRIEIGFFPDQQHGYLFENHTYRPGTFVLYGPSWFVGTDEREIFAGRQILDFYAEHKPNPYSLMVVWGIVTAREENDDYLHYDLLVFAIQSSDRETFLQPGYPMSMSGSDGEKYDLDEFFNYIDARRKEKN